MKENTKHNKAKKKKTGKHDHFVSLSTLIKLKRIIVLVRRNWPQESAEIKRDHSQSDIFS